MGSFGITRQALREELADFIGIRVGLAVDIPRIDPIISDSLPELGPNRVDGIRMSASQYNGLTFTAMRQFGDPATQWGYRPVIKFFYDLQANKAYFFSLMDEVHLQVHLDKAAPDDSWHLDVDPATCITSLDEPMPGIVDSFLLEANFDLLNIDALMERVNDHHGKTAQRDCAVLLEALRADQHLNPFLYVQRWPATSHIALNELFFGSKNRENQGEFLDQRLIDFLAVNLEDLDRIHWRQFERLTAEYFKRQGFSVELGPGVNDDGVDLRLWTDESVQGKPALTIVQCKRQRAKISKTVIKALWADVCAEGANTTGLVVTNSYISPGAQKVIDARSYDLRIINGDAVRRWIAELRTPGTGIAG